jgi:hypothetical protein
MPNISIKDANLILRNLAKFPQKGDQCNASCAFYFCCANGKDFEQCKGFQMLNGESEKLIRRGLSEHDLEYIENAHTFIQRSLNNGQQEQANVILRDISQLKERVTPQPTQHGSGFLAMLEASHPSNPLTTQEPQPEERARSGFSAMLRASAKSENTEHHPPVERQNQSFPAIQRQIDFETQLPLICVETCPIKRHCSSFPSNKWNVCVKQTEQYKNKYFVRSVK